MAERSKLEQDIDLMAKQLKSWEGMQVDPDGSYAKYFDLIYYHEGKEDETFTAARERMDVIDLTTLAISLITIAQVKI